MQDLKDFMKDFVVSDIQLREIYENLRVEIQKGLAKDTHEQSDVKCFATYVQDFPTGKEVGKYLALDLGGTNFRVLLVNFKQQADVHVISKIYAVPKEVMRGSGKQLFDHIAKCLAIFVKENNIVGEKLALGFTFSFPCVQLGLTKALLSRWTKGFQCSNVEHEDVGQLLKAAIGRQGGLDIDVMAVLNDTTGTLMSCGHKNPNCRIGVIIGTGFNACYIERIENVNNLRTPLNINKKYVIINTEWGAFGENGSLGSIRTEYDCHLDQISLNTSHQLFEKMISGMYLGELMRLVFLKAVQCNLLFTTSSNRAELVRTLSENPGCFETRMISEIEGDQQPEFNTTRSILKQHLNIDVAQSSDCVKLKYICECVTRRAANLVAVGLSVLINKMNEPDVVIGVDGSVYRLHPKFDQYMREALQKFVRQGINYELMLSEDGSGRGAALVAAVASKEVGTFA